MHIIQFSTGAGSAEVAYRVVTEYGRENVVLMTADTRVEDADNWRFARDVVADLGGPKWVVLADGRTPMQVGRDERCVPNNRMAVCSRVLKRDLLRRYLDTNHDPRTDVVYLGFDWTETHRLEAATPHWAPWNIAAPLMQAPYLTKAEILAAMSDRGIEPPRLYADGFSHANCGGACVRGGQAQWRLLLATNPERYDEWQREEEATRQMLGKDVSILRDRRGGTSKPLSLKAFRDRLDNEPKAYDAGEWGACGCFTDDESKEPTNQGVTKMTSEFEVIGSTARVTGEALLPEGTELEHGDELYVVCKVTVKEVSFPETKEGAIIRVHKAKADDAFIVDAEDAERVIAAERERTSGQGNLIAEINRIEANADTTVDTAGLL